MKKLIVNITLTVLSAITISQSAKAANSFGFRFSPITILVGIADVDIDFALGSNWVLSPGFTAGKWTFANLGYIQLSGGSLQITYHVSGAFTDSFYIGAFGRTLKVKAENSSGLTAEGETKGGGIRAGYEWVWTSFYQNLGISFYNSDVSKITYSDGSTENIPGTSAGLDYKIGWSF